MSAGGKAESSRTSLCFVGLGSNLGNGPRQLRRALLMLQQEAGFQLLRCSKFYSSPPWGYQQQPHFTNAVAALRVSLGARQCLDALLRLEQQLGRRRSRQRWGPRVIDLDLLLFDQEQIEEPGLIVPHPRITQRAFVLVPLVELEPEIRIPGSGSASSCLARLPADEVREIEPLPEHQEEE